MLQFLDGAGRRIPDDELPPEMYRLTLPPELRNPPMPFPNMPMGYIPPPPPRSQNQPPTSSIVYLLPREAAAEIADFMRPSADEALTMAGNKIYFETVRFRRLCVRNLFVALAICIAAKFVGLHFAWSFFALIPYYASGYFYRRMRAAKRRLEAWHIAEFSASNETRNQATALK